MNLKVSIIIPVYNVAPYIGACLESVYDQTYSNIEVILVNDCSPDNTMEVAEPYIVQLRKRFQVSIFHQKKNSGQSAARNVGLIASTGEFVYFLDSDDEITPNCIELLIDLVKKYPDLDFAIAGVKVVGSKWVFPVYSQELLNDNASILADYVYGKWNVLPVNKLLRKDYLIRNNIFFIEGFIFEDELYCFQLASTAKCIISTQIETYVYKVRQSNSTTAKRGFAQYKIMLDINRQIFDYIREQCSTKNPTFIARYIVNKVYSYILVISSAEKLTTQEKISLCKSQLMYYGQMFQFVLKSKGVSMCIKKIILTFPVRIILFILKIHSKLIYA